MSTLSSLLVGSFFAAMLLNVPIALALGFASVIAIVLASPVPPVIIAQSLYSATDSFTLLAIPFFIIAGNLMKTGGVSRRLIDFAKKIVGAFPGGLGHVAILTSIIFAAISGSGPATVAALGLIMIPSMVKAGYDVGYASALQASSGGIGVIIPPSIPMVLYGVLSGASIASMFAAGIGPGILIGLLLMVTNYIISLRRGYRGEAVNLTFKEFWHSAREAFLALLMPVIILGGIYSGIFTPTESAGVAVIYGFVVGTFVYREIKLQQLKTILLDSAVMSAVCIIVISMASPFGWVLTADNIPRQLAELLSSFFDTPIKFFLAVNFIFLLLGCFMSSTAALIILTPILLPIVNMLGINLVHFGIVMVINLELGMITPPFGVNLFVACGIAKISIEKIARQILPFLGATIVGLLLTTFIPWISLLLPKLMGLLE